MADVIPDTRHRRLPWLAVVLSLIMAGLGHIYAGRLVKGLVLAFLCFVLIVVLQVGLTTGLNNIVLAASFVLGTFVVPVVAMADSYYIAKHAKPDYELKEYNRWYVYVLLALISTGGGVQIAFATRQNYIEAFRVPAASMYPTIIPGDRILAKKTAYRNTPPARGDVIVFLNPDNRRINYVKRVVAVAGDTVEVRDGCVYVNGESLKQQETVSTLLDKMPVKINGSKLTGKVFEEWNNGRRYQVVMSSGNAGRENCPLTTVPENHCFVLGDNRDHSADSRKFGPVPFGDIKGKVTFLYFPARSWSRFGKIDD